MPETHYAKSGDVNIAYQVVGEGPVDLLYAAGWVTNLEVMWEDPGFARFLNRLASFTRLICFDKRGIGLSDPVPAEDLTNLDIRMRDMTFAAATLPPISGSVCCYARDLCIDLSGKFPVVSRDPNVGELRARGGSVALVV